MEQLFHGYPYPYPNQAKLPNSVTPESAKAGATKEPSLSPPAAKPPSSSTPPSKDEQQQDVAPPAAPVEEELKTKLTARPKYLGKPAEPTAELPALPWLQFIVPYLSREDTNALSLCGNGHICQAVRSSKYLRWPTTRLSTPKGCRFRHGFRYAFSPDNEWLVLMPKQTDRKWQCVYNLQTGPQQANDEKHIFFLFPKKKDNKLGLQKFQFTNDGKKFIVVYANRNVTEIGMFDVHYNKTDGSALSISFTNYQELTRLSGVRIICIVIYTKSISAKMAKRSLLGIQS